METGSEKSFRVLPMPLIPFPAMPPDMIIRYDRQPSAMAPLMSESGAGREMDCPLVPTA